MEALHDGVVEGIEEPRGHGELSISKDSENVQFRAWSKTSGGTGQAGRGSGGIRCGCDQPRHESAMTVAIQGTWIRVLGKVAV